MTSSQYRNGMVQMYWLFSRTPSGALQTASQRVDADAQFHGDFPLPAALSIDPDSGEISGIRDATGVHTVTVTTNDGTLTESGTFTLTVADALAAITEDEPRAKGVCGELITEELLENLRLEYTEKVLRY